ncbi:MAG TPA: PilT/PilU family type 4a pilus ATPase [Actinomycetota bacterium]
MNQVQRPLGQVLLDSGLVTPEQMNYAQQEESKTGNSAWKVLLERGILSERDLVKARAEQVGLDFVDVRPVKPTPEALALVDEATARRQLLIPCRVQGDVLVVAMAEPTNHLAVDELTRSTGKRLNVAAAYRRDLEDAIARVYGIAANGHDPGGNGAVANGAASFGPDDLPMVEAAPVEPQLDIVDERNKEPNLAEFLVAVIEKGASDLHLTGGIPPMIRVHGELEPIEGYRKLLPQDLQEMIYGFLTQKQREIFEEKLELDLSYSLPGRARFRVNIFQQRDALGAVMRLIPYEIKTLDSLGLPTAVKEFANLRRGLVLVTGITGSGKSTTLAGLVDIINETRAEHIMTVEDPIEFLHRHKRSVVNQREVGTDTHAFATALKHVLRQDPDVILVGEMRDLETISTALTAAETGHLVFGTLHTQDAPQSVDRVIDVFPPHQQQQIRVQLAGTLAGVVSQQLLPTADKKGRAVAAEILVATPAVRNLVREGKTHQIYTSMQAGGKFGMQVMDQHLSELVKAGTVSYEMALERAHHVEEFKRLSGRA